jgi:predicted RNase H-like HicB family nuclease
MEKTYNNKTEEKEYILSFEQIKKFANSGYTIKDLKEKIKEFEK